MSVKVIPPCVRYRGKALQTEHYHELVVEERELAKAEKFPAEKCDERREQPLDEPRRLFVELLFAYQLFYDVADSVYHAPEKIAEPRAVPYPREQKDREHVEDRPFFALPAAAEGNVDVFPEPCAEGDVPAAPEFGD